MRYGRAINSTKRWLNFELLIIMVLFLFDFILRKRKCNSRASLDETKNRDGFSLLSLQ